MNARKEIRDHLIAVRMRYWFDVAQCPLVNLRCPTWRARKNFWALVRKYPEIAASLGYAEASVLNSPLHGVSFAKPPVICSPAAPAQEQPRAAPSPSYSPPAMHGGVPRHVLLDDEVL